MGWVQTAVNYQSKEHCKNIQKTTTNAKIRIMTEMEHILTNPRKLGELLKEVIAEFGGEEAVNNAISK
jgi:hypothetical protein